MGIVVIARTISHHHPNNEVIVGELLPRDIHWSTHWSVDWFSAFSERLLRKIQQNNFHESRPDWTLPDNSLNMQLYHKDHLHHIESRNVKFPKSITETLHDVADSLINSSPPSSLRRSNLLSAQLLSQSFSSLSVTTTPSTRSVKMFLFFSISPSIFLTTQDKF